PVVDGGVDDRRGLRRVDPPAEVVAPEPDGRDLEAPQHLGSHRCHRMAMPINPDAVGSTSDPIERSWNSKDALLYAVGIGAGAIDPLAPGELPFTTENSRSIQQQV